MSRASIAANARARSTGPKAAPASSARKAGRSIGFPARNSRASTDKGSAKHAYYIWVDRYNTLGLGANVPIASTNGGESLPALVDGKFVDLVFPIRSASSPRMSTAGSTIRMPAGRAGVSGRRTARAPSSTAKAARTRTQSLQGADASRPAGELSGGTR